MSNACGGQSKEKVVWDYVKLAVSIVGVLVALGTAFYVGVEFIDWRVRSVVAENEFIERVAREVRPYVIFDQRGSILSDGGAMAHLVRIEEHPIEVVLAEEDSGGFHDLVIHVRPELNLATAPILEVLSTHDGVVRPERGIGYEWIYYFHIGGYTGGDGDAVFRLEILK